MQCATLGFLIVRKQEETDYNARAAINKKANGLIRSALCFPEKTDLTDAIYVSLHGWCWGRYAVDSLAIASEKVQNLQLKASKPAAVKQIGFLLIVGGIIVIVVSIYGMLWSSQRMASSFYATCLMVIVTTQKLCSSNICCHAQSYGRCSSCIVGGIFNTKFFIFCFLPCSHLLLIHPSFAQDFRQILKASLKLYNGTDTASRMSDDTVLMKAAWDKIMIEKSCCGLDSKIDFNESGWYQVAMIKSKFCASLIDSLQDRCVDCNQYCIDTDIRHNSGILLVQPIGEDEHY
uniref:Tetraspanin family protein n=1 Tax=Wuchereria bancrofti TaxID=6293 RepID=A0A1I8EQN1_WUCBA